MDLLSKPQRDGCGWLFVNGCSLFEGVGGVWFGGAFVFVACLLCFGSGFVFVALCAYGLQVFDIVCSAVFEVGDVVYFGCFLCAVVVVELACAVISIEGVGS